MSSDAPAPVTKEREWLLVAKFRVADTPDPSYDVTECERMADRLATSVESVLHGIAPIHAVMLETLAVNEP